MLFKLRPDKHYIVFNKPYGVLSQFTLPTNAVRKRTLGEFGFPAGVYPIGRLDEDSEGMILLSDDSRLTGMLLDPEHGHARMYLAQVDGVPTSDELKSLRNGVKIFGRMTRPAKVALLDPAPEIPERNPPIRYRASIPTSWLSIEITEGRNRQVRRMTAAAGHPTLRLLRESIGSLRLEDLRLEQGEWRELTEAELVSAFAETVA